MHQAITWPQEKAALYKLLSSQLSALIECCPKVIPSLANCSALLWEALPDINWAGFYLTENDRLILGPFQGRVACTVIRIGSGVCGTAAAEKKIQLVKDVHQFPGHIACDSASNSEIVIPLIKNDTVIGVMDIDSPIFNRFDDEDAIGLQQLCNVLLNKVQWN